ncbi:MAG: hypothetical protein HZC49_00040 [Nitrospirae bacterium]|nr:hypothetical protein [Nitrospirota bacterium]
MSDTKQFTLSEDEIIERLRTDDPEIVDTIHTMCLDVLYKEEDRTKSLDAKGSTLLGMSGLSSSLVFSLGGLLIEKIKAVTLPVIGDPVQGIGCFYISSSVTLLLSILFALLSVRARADFRQMKDEDIFRTDMIEAGNGPYKRYMATHAWKVYQNNFMINEKKGNHLRTGHVLFFAGLLQLLPIIIIIGLYAFMKGG